MPANHMASGLANPYSNGYDVGPTYQSIFGASLVAIWDARYGYTIADVGGANEGVDTWEDIVGGYVVSAPAATQRPVRAADGSNFLGKPVIQCATTGSKFLRSLVTMSPAILTAGQYPYTLTIYRYRSGTAAGRAVEQYNTAQANWRGLAQTLNDAGTGALGLYVRDAAGFFIAPKTVAVGTVMTIEHYLDPADGFVVSTANWGSETRAAALPAGLTVDVDRYAFGGIYLPAQGQITNSSIAMHLVLNGKPTVAQRAALRTLAAADWGTP